MTRRRTVTEQAATAAIEQGCRMLRLPTIRERFAEIAAAAEREQMTYLGFLSELVPKSLKAPRELQDGVHIGGALDDHPPTRPQDDLDPPRCRRDNRQGRRRTSAHHPRVFALVSLGRHQHRKEA